MLGEAVLNESVEYRGYRVGAVGGFLQGFRRGADLFLQQLRNRISLKRRCAGDHLVEHDAQCIDVCSGIKLEVQHGLGGHVLGGTDQSAGARQGGIDSGIANKLCNAEIEELDLRSALSRAEEDIGGLDISVHDPAGVRGVEGAAEMGSDVENLHQGDRGARLEPGGERLPLQ